MCGKVCGDTMAILIENLSYTYPDGRQALKSVGARFEKGKKTGKWTYYHQSGEKESEGKYKNDEKIKVWKYYDNNGNLKDEVRHSFL